MNGRRWSVTNSLKRLATYAQSILTFAAFIAIAYWGHHTHWQFTVEHTDAHAAGDEHASPGKVRRGSFL